MASIEITAIWEDDDLFEVEVTASNGRFSGSTHCYSTRSEILRFADELDGYPKSLDHSYEFSTGPHDNFSFFSCTFNPTHETGHYQVRIEVAHIMTYGNRPQERAHVDLSMKVEPAAIDTFVKQLRTVAKHPIKSRNALLNCVAQY